MMSKRLTFLILLFSTLLILLLATTTVGAESPVQYDLKIAGTRVTSANAADILGDGVFTYKPSEKKLTIDGDCKTTYPNVIESEIDGLTILAARSCTLQASTTVDSIAISLRGNTTMKGVQIIAYGTYIGVYVANGADLTVDLSDLTAVAKYGITAENNETLHVTNKASVGARGTEFGAICNFKSIELGNELLLADPKGAVNKNGTIYESDGTTWASHVSIDDEIEYGFYVTMKDVTSKNKDDILGDGGTFRYDPETNTLFVCGDYEYDNSYEIIWNIKCPGLTVNALSDATLYNKSGGCLDATMDTYITGNGKLNMESDSNSAIEIGKEATLTIFDADVTASSSNRGIYCNSYSTSSAKLVVRNSNLTVHCNNPILNVGGGIELTNCQIVSPSEYVIEDGTIKNPGGESSPNQVVIQKDKEEQYMLEIQGKLVTSGNAADVLGNGVFCYDNATKTLTVHGNCKTYTYGQSAIVSGIDGLTIDVTGDSVLQSESATLEFFANTTIQGSGKLTLRSNEGAVISVGQNALLTIKNATVDAEGETGFDGSSSSATRLNVINSNVSIKSEQEAASFPGGISLEKCTITSPKSAYIKNGSIMRKAGLIEMTLSTVTITQTGGYVPVTVKSVKNVAGNLRATVQNDNPYTIYCRLIVAYYDNSGRLIRSAVVSDKGLLPEQEALVMLSLMSGTYVSSAAQVKLFICANGSMEPLTTAYQIK